jgi:hypothetical protein
MFGVAGNYYNAFEKGFFMHSCCCRFQQELTDKFDILSLLNEFFSSQNRRSTSSVVCPWMIPSYLPLINLSTRFVLLIIRQTAPQLYLLASASTILHGTIENSAIQIDLHRQLPSINRANATTARSLSLSLSFHAHQKLTWSLPSSPDLLLAKRISLAFQITLSVVNHLNSTPTHRMLTLDDLSKVWLAPAFRFHLELYFTIGMWVENGKNTRTGDEYCLSNLSRSSSRNIRVERTLSAAILCE